MVRRGVISSVNLKILHWDLETAPMVSYHWRPKTEYIGQHLNIDQSFVMTWSAKWDGTPKKQVMHDCLTSEEMTSQDDSRIISSMADLIREADVVVAHNGDRFDLRVLNTRVAQLQLEPLGPVDTIDTLKLAKASFAFPYNTLDHLASVFLGKRKIETTFDLWRAAYMGDERAIRKLVRYCDSDVHLLEGVFHAMLPYVKNLRRLTDSDGFTPTCPTCGSTDKQSRGTKRTKTMNYRQYQCTNCKRYYKGVLIGRSGQAGL